MPLYQKLTLQGLDFCLWTIEEEEVELKSMLGNENWYELEQITKKKSAPTKQLDE